MGEVSRALARQDLLRFTQLTKPDYVSDPFHETICCILEKFHADVIAKKSPRVIIVAHPQSGKTELASRRYPAWAFGKNPELAFIGSSYNIGWASDICRDVQTIMDSEEYHQIFPDVWLPGPQTPQRKYIAETGRNRKRVSDYFELATHSGRYKAAGRGGGAAGRPATVIIIDDLLKNAEEAMSQTIRESAWEHYTQDLHTRLQMGGGILIMNTRWSLDDPIGRLIEHMQSNPLTDQFDVHIFPALHEPGTWERSDSDDAEACAPLRFDKPTLITKRATLNTAAWNALYQGNPVALTGNILPSASWKYYGGPGQPGFPDVKQFDAIVDTWDGAFKDNQGSDFCAGQRWGIRGAERWLFPNGYVREQMAYPRFKQAIRELAYQEPQASWKFIEDAANGAAVIADLKTEIAGLTAVHPQGGKIARAWAASADLCAGNCFIPDPSIAPWIGDFVRRCAVFPSNIDKPGSDDDIDAFTQMINQMRSRVLGFIQFVQQKEAKMEAAMAERSTLQKPGMTAAAMACPKCASTAVGKVAGQFRCNSCGVQFMPCSRCGSIEGTCGHPKDLPQLPSRVNLNRFW